MQVHASKGATLGGGGGSGPGSNIALIAGLRQTLAQAMQQNAMMRARLQKIHIDSEVADLPAVSSKFRSCRTRNLLLSF